MPSDLRLVLKFQLTESHSEFLTNRLTLKDLQFDLRFAPVTEDFLESRRQ